MCALCNSDICFTKCCRRRRHYFWLAPLIVSHVAKSLHIPQQSSFEP